MPSRTNFFLISKRGRGPPRDTRESRSSPRFRETRTRKGGASFILYGLYFTATAFCSSFQIHEWRGFQSPTLQIHGWRGFQSPPLQIHKWRGSQSRPLQIHKWRGFQSRPLHIHSRRGFQSPPCAITLSLYFPVLGRTWIHASPPPPYYLLRQPLGEGRGPATSGGG